MLCVALCITALAAAQEPTAMGRRIIDVVAELRDEGTIVIYSDELLTDEMRVLEEPTARAPLERLREMLRPHGLTVEPGPRDSWLVVRDAGAGSRPPPDEPPPRPRFTVRPPSLEEVVVSASRYSIARLPASSTSQIDRIQLENTPTLGSDALRVTHGLPGVTSSGLTARTNVRGGTSNEALLYLDGVQLFDPFHLKDFQSLFSSIDPGIVDSLTVYTGAFPAAFGDRMSAVIDMRTVEPPQDSRYELGASLLTTSALGAGRFADGRGSWLASARRGNLDLLIGAANPELGSPEYEDLYAKVGFALDSAWSVHAGVLALKDEITLHDGAVADASADYDDSYVWARADYSGEKLDARFLVTAAELTSDRVGEIDDPLTSAGTLLDDRRYESAAVKADWAYLFNDRHLLSWGAELRRSSADYRYVASRSLRLPISLPSPLAAPPADLDVDERFEGRRSSAYVSYRARPLSSVTTDIGLRWDAQSYLEDHQISPRVNVLLDLTERLRLRASWGKYFQTQRLDELQVNDGLVDFLPAQESEHYVLGIEYLLGGGTSVRLEAYRKEIEQIQPRSENLYARVSLLPELLPDRVTIAPLGGESTGLELSADGEIGRWRWWASLTRARTYDVFENGRAARDWEEPWSLKGGAIRTGDVWNLALTTTWHSGWPISALRLDDGQLAASAFNGRRFGEFGSVDLRLSRAVRLERSELEWYVSVTNVIARDNACCIDYEVAFDDAGRPSDLTLVTDHWLSIVPNVGVLWRFGTGDR